VISTGSDSVKQSAGSDLTNLFVGSEGTLGLISEATLKLAPLPEHFSAVVSSFATTADAAQAVFGIMGAGLNPAALELLDAPCIGVINLAEGFDWQVAPTLFLEFHGASEASLQVELELVKEICEQMGAQSFTPGLGREARDRLWRARHHLAEFMFRIYPGQPYLITDVAVPISQYLPLVAEAAERLGYQFEVAVQVAGARVSRQSFQPRRVAMTGEKVGGPVERRARAVSTGEAPVAVPKEPVAVSDVHWPCTKRGGRATIFVEDAWWSTTVGRPAPSVGRHTGDRAHPGGHRPARTERQPTNEEQGMTVIATSAGAFGSFLQKRGQEIDDKH